MEKREREKKRDQESRTEVVVGKSWSTQTPMSLWTWLYYCFLSYVLKAFIIWLKYIFSLGQFIFVYKHLTFIYKLQPVKMWPIHDVHYCKDKMCCLYARIIASKNSFWRKQNFFVFDFQLN